MSKRITIELDPSELNILAGWANDYFKSPTDGNNPQAQRLALDIMSANARYMAVTLMGEPDNITPEGMRVYVDEHATVPTLIDVASWGLPAKWCPHCLTCYEPGVPHVGCRP